MGAVMTPRCAAAAAHERLRETAPQERRTE